MTDQGAGGGDLVRQCLELGFVAVLAGRRPCGAGLLADGRHVLTCAHVVNTALGRDPMAQDQPADPVAIRFPYAAGCQVDGEVVAWRPAGTPGGDVAVLALHEAAPEAARPVRLVEPETLCDHPFLVWGFPQGQAGEMLAEGALSRPRSDALVQMHTIDGQPVRAGYSGAPVWDGASGGVVGIVTSFDATDPATRTSYLLPVPVLRAAWPDLHVEPAAPVDASTTVDAVVRVVGDRVSAAVETWRDRKKFLEDLTRLVLADPGKTIVSVTGRRGIGKSAVVAKVLARFEAPDPGRSPLDGLDGLVYLSTRTGAGGLTLARVYESLARLSGADEDRLLRRWENMGAGALPELWGALRHRRIAVALDNLDDLQDADTGRLVADDIVAFLESACTTPHRPRVVTTSQRPLGLPPGMLAHVEVIELDAGLPPADALVLLRSMDAGTNTLESAPADQLTKAAARLYNVPRGLELLAQAVLADPMALDDLLGSEAAPEALVLELVGRSFTRLDADGRSVVGVLALAGVPLSEHDIGALLDGLVEPAVARDLVRKLVRGREIGYDPASRQVRLHPLDADYVRTSLLAHEPAAQVTLDLRLAGWYARAATPPSSWRNVADASPNVKEYEHRWRAGDHTAALAALTAAAEFLGRKKESQVLRAAVGASAGMTLDPAARFDVLLCRYNAEFFAGSLDAAEAALHESKSLVGELGDAWEASRIDLELGTVLRHRGDAAAAVALLRPLADAAPGSAAVTRETRMDSLFELGLSLCYLGDHPGALDAATAFAALLEPADPGALRARPSDIRSLALLVAGDLEGAIAATDDGIALYLDSSDQDNAGYLYNVRGLAWLGLGDVDAAARELDRGRALAADYGVDRLEGICSTNLAWAQLRGGHWDEARASAATGADRLASNGVRAAATPRKLGDLLAGPPAGTPPAPPAAVLDALRAAASGSAGNTDVYQPPALVLEGLAEAMASGLPGH